MQHLRCPPLSIPTFLLLPYLWFAAIIVWYVTLLMLSSQSQLHPPGPEFMHRDKVMHATYFAIGGVFLYFALRLLRPRWSAIRISIFVILFCAIIGALDEYRQSFTPHRSGNDLGDWIADTTGGIIACLISPRLLRWFKR